MRGGESRAGRGSWGCLVGGLLLLVTLLLPTLFIATRKVGGNLGRRPGVGIKVGKNFGSSVCFADQLRLSKRQVRSIRGGCGMNCFTTVFFQIRVGERFVRPRVVCGVCGNRVTFGGGRGGRGALPRLTGLGDAVRSLRLPVLCNCDFMGDEPCNVTLFVNPGLRCM